MSTKRSHLSDYKWDQVLRKLSRREFILSSAAAGVLTMAPRFVRADARPVALCRTRLPQHPAGGALREAEPCARVHDGLAPAGRAQRS